jgi:chemotaxis protein CheZ
MSTTDTHNNAPNLLAEMEKMAAYILNAKREIAAIVPDGDAKVKQINAASIELNEVIKATEDATNQIMDAAEAIQSIAEEMPDSDTKQKLNAQSGSLMEACSFQDITGQRITKVLRVLEHVEARVGNLVKIFGGELPEGYVIKETVKSASRPDELLMNGPQLGKDAPSQDDIDKLFASI